MGSKENDIFGDSQQHLIKDLCVVSCLFRLKEQSIYQSDLLSWGVSVQCKHWSAWTILLSCDVCLQCMSQSVCLSVCLSIWLLPVCLTSLSPSALPMSLLHQLIHFSFLRTSQKLSLSLVILCTGGVQTHITQSQSWYKWFGLFVQTCVPQWFLVTTANNMPGNLVSGWTHLWVFPYIFTLLLILCMCVCL